MSFFEDGPGATNGTTRQRGTGDRPSDRPSDRSSGRKTRGRKSPSGSGRPTRSKRNVRIQRLLIALVALFIIVFLLAIWIRSCSHNRKVTSYQEYFLTVEKSVDASNAVGQELKKMVQEPTSYTRQGLSKLLDDMVREQTAVADQAARLEPPEKLRDENTVFVQGMDVRKRGYEQWREAIGAVLKGKQSGVSAKSLTALGSFFCGPEAYYQSLFYKQSQRVMADEGVTNVTVPKATYYSNAQLFTPAKMEKMLKSIGKSASLKGIHGVALTGVVVQPGDQRLETGKTNNIKASAELSFVVSVENQGTVTEKNVPVTITLIPPEGENLSQQKLEATIASIKSGETETASAAGFNLDPAVIGPELKLRVQVGPVPQEQVATNNRATYTVTFQL